VIFLLTIAALFIIWLLIDTYLVSRWSKALVDSVNKIYDGIKAFIGIYIIDSITNIDNGNHDDDEPEAEANGEA
jgi:hypothetical protein